MIRDGAFVLWFSGCMWLAMRPLLARAGDLFDELARYLGGLFVASWTMASVVVVMSRWAGWWLWLIVDAIALVIAVCTLRRRRSTTGTPPQPPPPSGAQHGPGAEVAAARASEHWASWGIEQAIAYAFLAFGVYGLHKGFAHIVGQVRADLELDAQSFTSSRRLVQESLIWAYGVLTSLASIGLLLMLLNSWLRRRGALIAGWRHQRSVLLLVAAAPIVACVIPSVEEGALLGGVLIRLGALVFLFWHDRGYPPEQATDFLKSPWVRAVKRLRPSTPVAAAARDARAVRLRACSLSPAPAAEPVLAIRSAQSGRLAAVLAPFVAVLVFAVAAPAVASRLRAMLGIACRLAMAAIVLAVAGAGSQRDSLRRFRAAEAALGLDKGNRVDPG